MGTATKERLSRSQVKRARAIANVYRAASSQDVIRKKGEPHLLLSSRLPRRCVGAGIWQMGRFEMSEPQPYISKFSRACEEYDLLFPDMLIIV